MEGSSKPFQYHGCWEIFKGWVLFEDPPQHRVAPMPVFGTVSSTADMDENGSSTADMDENGSPTIQQTRVENPSSGERFIPWTIG